MTDRWEPKDLDELRSFVENGGASETRFYEFKQELPSRNQVAKALAGFAIEGGALVIGVAEPEPGRLEVRPIPHAGLRERVEQIAQARVDPPLDVDSRVLKDPNDDSLGVLWVTVPESPQAPHQVGGVYYERGDTETRPMKDGAVVRLIQTRRRTLADIKSELRELMADDPITRAERAHVVGIARPVGAAEQELYEAIGGDSGWPGFCDDARSRIPENARLPGLPDKIWRPWLRTAVTGVAAPGRYRLCSHPYEDARDHYAILDVSFWEDGTVHYFSNQGSEPRNILMSSGDDRAPEHRDIQFLSPEMVVRSCLDVLDAAHAVGRCTSRRRSWDIGIGVSGTEGLGDQGSTLWGRQAFPDPDYAQVVRVTHQQLEEDPWGVAQHLTRGFAAGLGTTFERVAHRIGYIKPTDSP